MTSQLNKITDPSPTLTDQEATTRAYASEIEKAESFLALKLSVLIICDKLVVNHLIEEICLKAQKEAWVLRLPKASSTVQQQGGLSLRQRQVAYLREHIGSLSDQHVLVIPHLDLLAGGTTEELSSESREVIELIYEETKCPVLAFSDRSLNLPEVLQARFAARLDIAGVPRQATLGEGVASLGVALVTRNEVAAVRDYDPDGLHKHVVGMNPVRFRNAMAYAIRQHDKSNQIPATELYRRLQQFKTQRSEGFQIPNVTFDDIGGFKDVKDELERAMQVLNEGLKLDVKLQQELIPRGFMFHGPPGTGKTLFAKAIASRINATIQVVSGPEVTNMYVGESERRVRELFNEARSNAPAVLVFEEFDSIGAQRSGRDDGGSRAGNALVAQILTEMDGFRPEYRILVIGTTNQLQLVDQALLRPSRFRPIRIGLPDEEARRSIAAIHAKHFGLTIPEELLDLVAKKTPGFNGDEIRSIFRDACLGWHMQQLPPDARRLGELVGALRRQQSEKNLASSAHNDAQRGGGRAQNQNRNSADGFTENTS